MDYNNLLDLVKNRRTIRRFKSDPIPDEYMDMIIEAARWAPSGYNLQPWEFVMIKDKSLRDSILQWIHDYHKLIMKTEKAREEWQQVPSHPARDLEMDFRNAPVFILLLGDTPTQIGLPTSMRYDAERRQTIYTSSLANAYLYMSLAVAEGEKFLRDRKKMVHHDYCGKEDFHTDEEVNDFIKKTRIWTITQHRRGIDKGITGE